jgi:hypothetical protein
MAVSGGIPVEFGAVFPHGAFVIGEITPEADFDQSTKENRVQKRDKNTGLPVWVVPVMDADPEARKGQRELSVKVAAEVQAAPTSAGRVPCVACHGGRSWLALGRVPWPALVRHRSD